MPMISEYNRQQSDIKSTRSCSRTFSTLKPKYRVPLMCRGKIQNTVLRSTSYLNRPSPCPHSQHQTGAKAYPLTEVSTVQVREPRMRVVKICNPQSEGTIKSDVETTTHR